MKRQSVKKSRTNEPSVSPGGSTRGRLPKTRDDYADVLDLLREPGACDVRDRLLEHGASLRLTASVVRTLAGSRYRGAYAIDGAAKILGRAFPVLPAPKRKPKEQTFFVFTGPTGSGKTTTFAKLARRLIENGRKVLCASLDTAGPSRLRAIDADVDRTELPILSVRDAADLAKQCRRNAAAEVVLVDTPGLSPRDEAGLDQLAAEIDRIGELGATEVYLVVPATKSAGAAELVADAYGRLAPSGGVLTKLDETDEPLVVLEELSRRKLPLAVLCDGPDIRAHLTRPNEDRLADLALRGRLA